MWCQLVVGPPGVPSSITIVDIVNKVITPIFAIAGVVLFGLIIYGGFVWMTASGDPNNVKKAQGILVNATIGIAIVVSAALLVRIIGHILGYEGMGIF